MNIYQSYLTNNRCYKQCVEMVPKGLMLHSVGINQPSAKVFVNTWNTSAISKCVHAFIDASTGDVYQTLPWTVKGWHCGAQANKTHIGVEMCEPYCIKYLVGAKFTVSEPKIAREYAERTYASAVELFAMLCKMFDLDPLEDGVIISHSEGYKRGVASNHADPEHLWNQLELTYSMDTFREAVNNKLKDEGTIVTVPGKWYADGANWAVENGLITGQKLLDGSVEYDWQKPVTKEQLATILKRYHDKFIGI